MKRLILLALLLVPCVAHATTYFVRTDGGTLYNATATPTGQCNGKADAAYPGSGTNQACAVSSVQYLYLNGQYGVAGWNAVSGMVGGDTVVIRGCAALPGESNSDAPHCRIGIITNNNASGSSICQGPNPYGSCAMPPPPSGTSGAHTRIMGGCAYDGNCTPVNTWPYTSNLVQLFGGFGTGGTVLMQGASYVDLSGLEITEHNGACVLHGSPSYPATCVTSAPYSDFARSGIDFDNTSNHITLTDVYIHGMTELGIGGSHGQGLVFTRVIVAFNAYMGWNMDDGVGMTANATLVQSYMTIIGSGCLEQYPITDPLFPAKACWDDTTGGFGDSWSAGTTTQDTFSCDHCYVAYNMKDGLPGPHDATLHYSLTNSKWEANQGQSWKMSQPEGSTGIFTNNLILANCYRLEGGGIPPGANAALASHLYLGDACRAAGAVVAYNADVGSTVEFGNNTIVTYQPTIWQIGCNTTGACGSLNYNFHNNLYLGYTPGYTTGPVSSGQAPGVYYSNDSPYTINFVGSHNLEYGVRNGDACAGGAGINGNTCQNPLLVTEPAQGAVAPTESALDGFNFHLTSSSPAIATGTTYAGQPSTDYYGVTQTSPLTIGAVVFGSTPTVSAPIPTPTAGTYTGTQSVTWATSTGGASIVYTNDGTTPTVTALTCTITHGTLYSGAISVPASITLKAIGCLSGDNASSVTTAAYTITTPTVANPTFSPVAGTYVGTQSLTIASSTSGATICYRTDGTNPAATTPGTCDAGSTTYSGAISVPASITFKALGTKTGNANSGVVTAAYVINGAATPTFSPVAGGYVGPQSVTLATATTACTANLVWNTTNAQTGGNLTGTSSTNPLTVSASETVYAQVQGCSGVANSAVGSAAYTITAPTPPNINMQGLIQGSGLVSNQ